MDWKEILEVIARERTEPPKTVRVGEINAHAAGLPQPRRVEPPVELPALEVNEAFLRAIGLIESGAPLLFITGKAGTGKSTFIDFLRVVSKKNIAVTAPTGVAALRARGQTIHSFFHFPPRPIDPESLKPLYDRRVFRRLDVLVVDEISMVRADLFDAMEKALRLNTGRAERPFGGVQVVLVGDLFQLPPVVAAEEEARLFAGKYASPYFFSAHCLQDQALAFVEMNKVYRQENEGFVRLLNAVRENEMADRAIEELNRACLNRDLNSDTQLVLTPTNAVAGRINAQRLAALAGEEVVFEGRMEGKFNIKQDRLPAPHELRLKIGAQVMFVKNDADRRWVNGTVGVVQGFPGHSIQVAVDDGKLIHEVQQDHWDALEYRHDPDSDSLIVEIIGRYTQFPLMPAWAVTIHKSQGQTLDQVTLDLGRGAFAPGQLYVALSRCRTMEGLRLQRPIRKGDVKVDERIKRFHALMRAAG
ncbi:MAG: AAA family ATPase [Pseudomonadota bacterium]